MQFNFSVEQIVKKYAQSTQGNVHILYGDHIRTKRADKDVQLIQIIDSMGEASARVSH